MADKKDIQQAEEQILRNIESPVQSYEVDGEKVTHKDASRQLDALERMKSHAAAVLRCVPTVIRVPREVYTRE